MKGMNDAVKTDKSPLGNNSDDFGKLVLWYKALTESIAVLYEIYEIYSLGLLRRFSGEKSTV